MSCEIIATPFFMKKVKELKKKYINIADDLKKLNEILVSNPKSGILLFENIYKIRLINSNTKSKRGGYRVIYYLQTKTKIYLLTIYSKKEKENISKNEILNILNTL